MLAPEWKAVEWKARMDALLAGLGERIPADVREACESMNFGGEFEECADNLLAALQQGGVAVRQQEVTELRALTEAVASHVDGLDYLAGRRAILDEITVIG
ncbi:hypothetical protein [Nocardia sp. XZ_19_369]|uniref:hypothetical protein n=1 Tax=Nocardia sp. XZ_19_369 TaxID=2769487 RepID=UPI00188EEB36|nr:hypothetical protein [Nocardia sp. XZ_19_369]